jgi:hypothetical protein
VIAQKAELQVGTHGLRPPNVGIFDIPAPITPYVFPQGISQPELALLAATITHDIKASIDKRVNFVWLCGFIRYRDSVPREVPTEYMTRFCYVYSESGGEATWSLGPGEYNQAT